MDIYSSEYLHRIEQSDSVEKKIWLKVIWKAPNELNREHLTYVCQCYSKQKLEK